uniref:G-protein coupled receptors family 3 profile domain-containing protein n=1 Tax=Mucochytrium quahogii TaxID=96639 RepID=A0A7S2WDS0_9STRA|mmetsp:Transcript_20396/g.44278  ORF Transcript_20396/g.44278 Transcript_20396/m.44278 type:complete len:447 (+) Transcript_20396:80-1420(+)
MFQGRVDKQGVVCGLCLVERVARTLCLCFVFLLPVCGRLCVIFAAVCTRVGGVCEACNFSSLWVKSQVHVKWLPCIDLSKYLSMGAGDGRCDGEDELAEFRVWIRAFGLGIFVFGTLLYSLSIAWWLVNKRQVYLAHRSFGLMFTSALGGYLVLIADPLSDFVGRKTVQCDLYVWLSFAILPLLMGPVTVRLLLFYNTARFHELVVQENERDDDSTKLLRRLTLQPVASSLRAWVRFFFCGCCSNGYFVDDTTSEAQKQERKPEGMSAPDLFRTRSTSQRSIGGNKTSAFYAATKPIFTIGVMMVFVIISAIGLGVKLSLKPTHQDDCYGCKIEQADLYTLAGVFGLVFFAAIFVLIKARRFPDPLGIISELQMLVFLMCIYAVALILAVLDPNEYQARGIFDYMFIGTFGVLLMHIVQCPYQVYRALQSSKKIKKDNAENVIGAY